MLSRRRRVGQPYICSRAGGVSGSPICTALCAENLLSILPHTDARRLPNFLLILCVARRRLLQVHEYFPRTRAAQRVALFGQSQSNSVKLRAWSRRKSRAEASKACASAACCLVLLPG